MYFHALFAVAVFVCFIICWTPYHVHRLLYVMAKKFDFWTTQMQDVQKVLHLLSGIEKDVVFKHNMLFFYSIAFNIVESTFFFTLFQDVVISLILQSTHFCIVFYQSNFEVGYTIGFSRKSVPS